MKTEISDADPFNVRLIIHLGKVTPEYAASFRRGVESYLDLIRDIETPGDE